MSAPRRRGACPGLSVPMPTGDGLLARLMPTGPVRLDAFRALCASARRHGNGTIEVTARGSLQVRGLSEFSAPLFAAEVGRLAIDLQDGVPVLAGPLAGADVAPVDPADIAAKLRRALRSSPLALSPKISVVVDGCGGLHLDAVAADIRLRATEPGSRPGFHVGLAGDGASATWIGTVLPESAVDAVIGLLEVIAAHGPAARASDVLRDDGVGAFRAVIDDIVPSPASGGGNPPAAPLSTAIEAIVNSPCLIAPSRNRSKSRGGLSRVMAALVPAIPKSGTPCLPERDRRNKPGDDERTASTFAAVTPPPLPPPRKRPDMVGLHSDFDGTIAVGVGLAFGHAQAEALAELAGVSAAYGAQGVRPAPDRTLLLLGVPAPRADALVARAEQIGFVVRSDDPRRLIAACPGAPSCASGLIRARTLAAELAPLLPPEQRASSGGAIIHISGCPKGCAHPAAAPLTIVGTERGCGIIRDGTARVTPDQFIDRADGLAECLQNTLHPHPEEAAAAAVSKDGPSSVRASILRDADLRSAPRNEGGRGSGDSEKQVFQTLSCPATELVRTSRRAESDAHLPLPIVLHDGERVGVRGGCTLGRLDLSSFVAVGNTTVSQGSRGHLPLTLTLSPRREERRGERGRARPKRRAKGRGRIARWRDPGGGQPRRADPPSPGMAADAPIPTSPLRGQVKKTAPRDESERRSDSGRRDILWDPPGGPHG